MPLQIATLLLVLGVTFLQAVFGFFSGLINLFCTVVAVVVAFGFYEPLTYAVTASMDLAPAYVEPCCLMLLFLLTQVGLRAAADNLIRGNVTVVPAMDWAGAGLCGFFTAMLTVGTLTIGLLMLPIGGTVMGFSRFVRTDEKGPNNVAQFDRKSLWTRCDEFTIWFFNQVSGGSMQGGHALASVYPDYLEALYGSRNTVQAENQPVPYREKKYGDGFTKGLRVDYYWTQKDPVNAVYRAEVPTQKERTPSVAPQLYKPGSGDTLLGLRLTLLPESADRDRRSPVHMFRPWMFRLVGKGASGKTEQYFPVIIGGADSFTGGKNRIVDPDVNFRLEGTGEGRIDAYFEVDQGFQPEFIEYKQFCRVAVGGEPKKTAPTTALKILTPEQQQQLENQGSRTFGSVADGRDNDKLPFTFEAARLKSNADCKVAGDALVHGRIFGEKSKLQVQAQDPGIEKLQIPQGRRILQIEYHPKQAASIFGEVFRYVGGVINQYQALDNQGNVYLLSGYYAIVKRGNNEYIEYFFNGPEDDPLDGSYRGLLDFKEIKQNELNDADDATIGLIFITKPGVIITRIQNQAKDGGDVTINMGE